MGFSFPVVQDRSGELLGGALANAFNTYRAAKRAPLEDEMAQLDYANRMQQAGMMGLRRGTAPAEPPAEPPTAAAPSTFTADYLAGQQPRGQGLASVLGTDFDKVNAMAAPAPGSFVPGQGFHSVALDGPHPLATRPVPTVVQAGRPAGQPSPLTSSVPPAALSALPSPAAGQPGRFAPATAPPPSPADRLAQLYSSMPRYQQLTPGYYQDYGAPGIQAQRLQAGMALAKEQAEIERAQAQAKMYGEHGDWWAGGGAAGAGGRRLPLQKTTKGLYDPNTQEYLTDKDGEPIMPVSGMIPTTEGLVFTGTGQPAISPTTGKQYQKAATSSTGTTPEERARRSQAVAAGQEAAANDKRGDALARELNNPVNILTSREAFKSGQPDPLQTKRDSLTMFRQRADTARALQSRLLGGASAHVTTTPAPGPAGRGGGAPPPPPAPAPRPLTAKEKARAQTDTAFANYISKTYGYSPKDWTKK
jgi:hypothetical protein